MLARVLLVALILFAGAAHAKNLYVNNSGSPACSDATTYANNDASNPWCTIGRAAWGSTSYASPSTTQAAAAGDVVLITAGTYTTAGNTVNSGCSRLVALNPANSGTAGNLITFRGVGTVNIYLAAGSYGPTIGAEERSYIAWDNVHIDDSVAEGDPCADSGPVVFHVCTGCVLTKSFVKGNATDRDWGDNYNGVRIEATSDIVISHNEIWNIVQASGGHNSAGIMLYDAADTIIENNRIYGSNVGIYIKGDHAGDGYPQTGTIVRNNWFEDHTNKCMLTVAGYGSRIYRNVLKNCNIAMWVYGESGQSVDIDFVNNTIIGPTSAYPEKLGWAINNAYQYLSDIRIYNNIWAGGFTETISLGNAAAIGDQDFEHNLYYGHSYWGSLNASRITFSTWTGTYSQDSATPASIDGSAPDFVSTSYPGGYKLSANSPARGLGVDVLDLDGDSSTTDTIPAGAYVTGNEVIGPSLSLLPGPGNPRWRPASLWELFMFAGALH